MTTATLSKFDMASIIANLSNTELHNCLADHSVRQNLGAETAELLRAEAQRRELI